MEFWCRNCNNEWVDDEQPKECPKCHDWQFEELYTCEDCGRKEVLEDFDFGRLFDGKCCDCFKKSVANSDVNAFVIWYVYCYNRNESEVLLEAKDLIIQEAFNFEFCRESNKPEHKVLIISLFDYLVNNVFDSKSLPSECELKIIQNVRDWVFDDMDFFYDWWCLRNGKNRSSVLWLSDEK